MYLCVTELFDIEIDLVGFFMVELSLLDCDYLVFKSCIVEFLG